MKNIIGFDFSINKPAACVFSNNKYYFYSWPYKLRQDYEEIYKTAGVKIINRLDDKEKGETLSSKMNYEVKNAEYLANLITETLKCYLNGDTYLAFEGLAYASTGDVVLQLGGYKYMLMSNLSKLVPFENMYTYSPITVKSIAGCAKRGMGKSEMIDKFIETGPVCKLRLSLFEFTEKFHKKGGATWIDNVDDFVDSYWVLETLRQKEKSFFSTKD
jgi:hypothetical protein